MANDQNLVWIDLEMSGLDLSRDVILEIATIITDNNLHIIAEGPDIIIHQPDFILDSMNEWCARVHGQSGLTQASRESTVSVAEAAAQTLSFISAYCTPRSAPLCGNSVHMDKAFLRVFMPDIDNYLHYRIVDVSSIKEVIKRWYPNSPNKDFKKPENHRALEDIRYSIAELEHYRKFFFITGL